jgi:hypothetical protein
VRLSRHARNRLRLISRRHPEITAERLLQALPDAQTLGYDDRGNRRARLRFGGITVIVVTDEKAGFLITVWVE